MDVQLSLHFLGFDSFWESLETDKTYCIYSILHICIFFFYISDKKVVKYYDGDLIKIRKVIKSNVFHNGGRRADVMEDKEWFLRGDRVIE